MDSSEFRKLLKDNPLVSILIPCYNAERWIAQTLESVLCQTYRDLEVIVVDDGSTDGTVEVVRSYVNKGVRVIRQSNSGASAARNVAFRESSGAFIQFLDADDLISPNKIGSQLERLLAQPNAVAMCQWGRFVDDHLHVSLDPSSCWNDLSPVDWLVETWKYGAGMLFPAMWLLPRAVVTRAGLWREDLSLNDDGEFFTRVVLASTGVLFCPAGTAFYRSGIVGSLSRITSARGLQSGFESIRSAVDATRSVEDSDRVRRCGSLLWQVYAHSAYPHLRTLANEALQKAQELHDVKIKPSGGRVFELASTMLGWKAARVLQKWSGRA
jgi:glycosyltransferase involved in cell wall biosynthesis